MFFIFLWAVRRFACFIFMMLLLSNKACEIISADVKCNFVRKLLVFLFGYIFMVWFFLLFFEFLALHDYNFLKYIIMSNIL